MSETNWEPDEIHRLEEDLVDIELERDKLKAEVERLREGVSAFVADLCLRAEELQRQGDDDDAQELWAEAEKWEKLLPTNDAQSE